MVAGTSDVQVTNELLFLMSLIFAIPILMVILSLTLHDRANRWANRIVGIVFVAFDMSFLGLTLFLWEFSAYETVWSFMYTVFTALVVWYSWKWSKQEEQGVSGAA